MLNLTRMNFYRIIRTKSIWIILLITIAFGALTAQLSHIDAQLNQELAEETRQDSIEADINTDEESTQIGISVETPPAESGKVASFMEYFFTNLQSGILLIFLAIACVLFFNQEHTTGFVKNIAGQTAHRSSIYFSKLLALIGYMLLTIVSYFFAFYVVTKLHWGSEMSFGWNLLADHWHILAIIILLHLAFISGLAMLTTLFHSNTLSITFGMFACFGMGSILDGFLYRVLHFHIVKYFVTTNLKNMSPGISGKPMWLALSVALVLTILYNSIGAIWFSKRDAA